MGHSWSSGNAFVPGTIGLRFKSQTGQIGHSVANDSPPLRHFYERSCIAQALQTRYTLQRHAASMMKDLIGFFLNGKHLPVGAIVLRLGKTLWASELQVGPGFSSRVGVRA